MDPLLLLGSLSDSGRVTRVAKVGEDNGPVPTKVGKTNWT